MLFCPICGSGLAADKIDYNTDKDVSAAETPGVDETNSNVNAADGSLNNPQPHENAAPMQRPVGQPQTYGQPAQFYGQPPYGQPPVRHTPDPRLGGWDTVRNAVKRVASSPVFLLAVILFISSQTAGIINRLIPVNIDLKPLMEFLEFAEIDVPHDFYHNFNDVIKTVQVGSTIMSSIPTFVIIAGLLATYASAKRRESGMSTAGLTAIQVVVVITFSAISLLLVLVLALVGLATLSLAVTPDEMDGEVAVGISIIVIALLGITAAIVSYYVCLIRTISAVKGTIMSGIPQIRGSMMYVAVVNFIIGGIGAVSSLPSALFEGDIITSVLDLGNAVAMILFGVAIVMYRSSMKELTYAATYPNIAGYVQPPRSVICRRCGSEYSDSLPACPRCGLPRNMQ